MPQPIDPKTIEARRKFVEGFRNTMIDIWKERIILFGAIRTGSLYRSVMTGYVLTDGEVTSIEMGFKFNEYGFYVDRGTGRGVYRGNPGRIAQDVKKRKAKPWLIKKFRSSEYNLRDFLLESLSIDFIHIMDDAPSSPFGGALLSTSP